MDNPFLLNAYGRYFWYMEINRATQIFAAYVDNKFVGVMLAEIKGEKKKYTNFFQKIYVKIIDVIQNIFFRDGAGLYEDTTKEQLKHYLEHNSPDGEIIFLAVDGATKKYAEWLAEETGYDSAETKAAKVANLQNYDVIILGGGVYASGIAGLQFLKKNIKQLSNKKIAVFTVGASPYDEKAISQIRELHFKNELNNIPLFYCRGAWNEEKMKFADRTLCKLLQKAVAKQNSEEYEPWQKALMCAVGQKCDWTDKSYLEPLLKHIQSL